MDFAQARYFSSVQGRFTSPDPLTSSGNVLQPQSWNRYTYCINNPLLYVDPSGLIWGFRNLEDGKIQFTWFDGNTVGDGYTAYTDPSYTFGNGRTAWLGDNGTWGWVENITPDDSCLNCTALVNELGGRVQNFERNFFQLYGQSVAAGLSAGTANGLAIAALEALTILKNALDTTPQNISSSPFMGTIKSDRQAGVREAWQQEVELVNRTGQGTRQWTPDELRELRDTGKVSGYEGHHINSVNGSPELARNPDNIKFVRGRAGNLAEHGGNFRNPTSGSFIRRR